MSLPVFQWGGSSQMRSKDSPADDMTTAWLAKVHDGMK